MQDATPDGRLAPASREEADILDEDQEDGVTSLRQGGVVASAPLNL
jgi:hypothetical protein